MHNTLKKTINAEEQLIEHNGENIMKNTKEQIMGKNAPFSRTEKSGEKKREKTEG